ncbi:MAG: alpha/beta hydrolase-fold protein [Bacteroidota bacterium]
MFRLCLLFFLCFSFSASAQITIIVDQIPTNTPTDDDIHVAGNFQSWNPGDPAYILSEDVSLNRHFIDLPNASGVLLFKFTRGSWTTVEGNANGGFIPDRSHTVNAGDTLFLQIEGWEDLGGGGNPNSTAAENVFILSDDFYMPQLDRNRRIWMYLPPDYETSGIDYPVLYMHDGQNVFDLFTSFAGEWEVDETLNDLQNLNGDLGIIVVAIENGGALRLDEYTPWFNPNYGGGEGDQYVDFLVQTLKPYIDANYRTLPQREYTGIMGSSLGGLISLYAAIKYQNIFGKVGALSPAYWINPEMNGFVTSTGKQADLRIYQLMGTLEGASFVADMYDMETDLFTAGFGSNEVLSVEKADGQHSEWFWAREFEEAYLWLCGNLTVDIEEPSLPGFQVNVFPNPASEVLNVQLELESREELTIELFNPRGQLIQQFGTKSYPTGLVQEQIDLESLGLSTGMYQLSISMKGKKATYPIMIK